MDLEFGTLTPKRAVSDHSLAARNSLILLWCRGRESNPHVLHGQRILSPGHGALLSLTKRDETGCTRQAVDYVSLRLVSYQHVLLLT